MPGFLPTPSSKPDKMLHKNKEAVEIVLGMQGAKLSEKLRAPQLPARTPVACAADGGKTSAVSHAKAALHTKFLLLIKLKLRREDCVRAVWQRPLG